jgi:GYF domain 2
MKDEPESLAPAKKETDSLQKEKAPRESSRAPSGAEPARKTYSRPVLAGLFNAIAALTILIGIYAIYVGFSKDREVDLAGYGAFAIAGMCIVCAVFCASVGQAIDFLGRTAFYSERAAESLSGDFAARLKRIEDRLAAQASNGEAPREVEFFYAINGAQEGPFSAEEMRDFRARKIIDEKTDVFRTGEKEWLPLEKFPDLMRS